MANENQAIDQVGRLKSGYYAGQSLIDEWLIGSCTDNCRHMAGTEQSVDIEFGILQQRLERSGDNLLGGKHAEIVDILVMGGQDRGRNPRCGCLESNAEKHHRVSGIVARQLEGVHG